jgi:hypothetical protein
VPDTLAKGTEGWLIAAVRRKEDFRFLTGQGTYTDDINRPGQLHAFLLRTPTLMRSWAPSTLLPPRRRPASPRSSPAPICKWAVSPAAGSSPRRTASP